MQKFSMMILRKLRKNINKNILQKSLHILKSNKRAIRYNIAIGYEIVNDHDLNENQLYVLTKESFNNKKNILNQFLN